MEKKPKETKAKKSPAKPKATKAPKTTPPKKKKAKKEWDSDASSDEELRLVFYGLDLELYWYRFLEMEILNMDMN